MRKSREQPCDLFRLVSALLGHLLFADAHHAGGDNEKKGEHEDAPPHGQERNNDHISQDGQESGTVWHRAGFSSAESLGGAVDGTLVDCCVVLWDIGGNIGRAEGTRELGCVRSSEAGRAVVAIVGITVVTAGHSTVLSDLPSHTSSGVGNILKEKKCRNRKLRNALEYRTKEEFSNATYDKVKAVPHGVVNRAGDGIRSVGLAGGEG